jgi:cobyrinic acid a,c-diamide synthase
MGTGHLGHLPANAPRPRIGYAAGALARDSALGSAGTPVKGHVFHRSTLDAPLPPDAAAFEFTEPAASREGYARGNLVASYLHMHFGAVPEIAAHWLARCRS